MTVEIIIGVSSVFIAFCAFGVSIWQGVQTRKHNKLSFQPHLTTWTHRDIHKGTYSIDLINNGLGPAIIESFTVNVDGKPISGEGTEHMEKALKIVFSNFNFKSHHSYVSKGYSMAAKERCAIVVVQFTDQLPSPEFVDHAIDRGELVISYKSFYNDLFNLSTQVNKSNQPLAPDARTSRR